LPAWPSNTSLGQGTNGLSDQMTLSDTAEKPLFR
jgi:hypothetical protein